MQSACQRELFTKTPASLDKTQKCDPYSVKSVVSKSHIAVSFAHTAIELGQPASSQKTSFQAPL